MWLTAKKTKKLGKNLWYQLYIHPECTCKADLQNFGTKAAAVYNAVKYYPEACPFCEYDAQQRIESLYSNNPIPECHCCPLNPSKGKMCCEGHFRKWFFATNIEERRQEAYIIFKMIKNWKL